MRTDVLGILWRFFSSRRLTLVLLTAIALVVSISAILPQIPQAIAVGSSQYGRWHAEMRAHYLQWADVFEALGLFSVYDSLWFKVPLSLLILNLAVCAVERFEAAFYWPKLLNEEFDHVFKKAPWSQRFVTPGRLNSAIESLSALLERHRYHVEVDEGDERSYLAAWRFSWARWGSVVAHLGMIIAIIGLLVGRRFAWREEGIVLSPGETYQIQHAQSVSLRLEDFEADLYPDGAPQFYRSEVTILEQEDDVLTGVVAPNAPLTYRGMAVYQQSHGPLITIKGLDAQGEPISLQALALDSTLQEQAILRFSEEDNEGYAAVPAENLILRLVFHPHQASESGERPAFLVQAYRDGMSNLVFTGTLFESASLQIEDHSYAIGWEHYAVLDVARDPGFSVTFLGAVSLLAVAFISLFLPPRFIRAAVLEKGGVVEVRLVAVAEMDKGTGHQDLDALMKTIEASL
jgi:cytochrome c biogenesis protein